MALEILEHRGVRPGPGWHRHGWTTRSLTIRVRRGLRQVLLKTQRWLEFSTKRTVHDRPLWELAWSSSTTDVVFLTLAAWLLAGNGLHRTAWPWPDDRPSRRTAQRWLECLRPDALRWQHAIRLAVIDRLAPRPLEEFLPTGGIPPPKGRNPSHMSAAVWQLHRGLWLLQEAEALLEDTPARTLLVEARRRLTPPNPSTT